MVNYSYNNFKELTQNETIDADYKISVYDRGSPATVVAPHGGKIEPKTSYIAGLVAGEKFNCYCFDGVKPDNNRLLHITSHKFDEPQALKLIARSQIVVTIHACTDEKVLVYSGGRDKGLIKAISEELAAAGVVAVNHSSKYRGVNPKNICNRGASGKGVQLEISRGLRDDINKVHKLSDAIHIALIKRLGDFKTY